MLTVFLSLHKTGFYRTIMSQNLAQDNVGGFLPAKLVIRALLLSVLPTSVLIKTAVA
jgi:hypothetical protein